MSRARVLGRIFTLLRSHGGVRVGAGLCLNGLPIVTVAKGASVTIGCDVVMSSNAQSTALGTSRPVIIRAMLPGARVRIGDNVGMSGVVICAAQSVEIGDECLLGADVFIADTDFHPLTAYGRRNAPLAAAESSPCSIGRNVFIGAGTRVLKGVSIGDNSVIGAGSVVTKSIPANMIAAGNPARVIKSMEHQE